MEKSKCMKLTRVLLQIAGVIPIKNPYNRSFRFNLISINVKVSMHMFGGASFMFLIHSKLTESLLALLFFLLSLQHSLRLYLTNKDNFAKMLDDADCLLENVLTDQEARDIFEAIDSSIIKFLRAAVFCLLSYTPLHFLPLAAEYISNRPFKNPYQLWLPFDSIILSYFFLSYIIIMVSFIELSYLSSIASVSLYVSSCLKILSRRIMNQPKFISQKLEMETIKIHSDIIKLVASMNENYGLMLITEILCASLKACFVGYQILVGMKYVDSNYFGITIAFIFAFGTPGFVGYCGQKIQTENENMYRMLYFNSWYERSPKNRKTVLFQMLMMSKSLKLHFRDFIEFNMAQFAAVLQSTYTAMAMMRLMLE